jgi:conjugative transfer region protein TrbK
MDLKIAARMIAVLALGAAMTAAVMAWRGDGTEDAPSHHLRHPGGEPERSELARCRDLGMAASDDAACKKAWAENRRRFLGTREPERPSMAKPERFGLDGEGDVQPKTINPPISLPVSP